MTTTSVVMTPRVYNACSDEPNELVMKTHCKCELSDGACCELYRRAGGHNGSVAGFSRFGHCSYTVVSTDTTEKRSVQPPIPLRAFFLLLLSNTAPTQYWVMSRHSNVQRHAVNRFPNLCNHRYVICAHLFSLVSASIARCGFCRKLVQQHWVKSSLL